MDDGAELTVYVLAHDRDGILTCGVLREAAIDCAMVGSSAYLVRAITRGCGVVLIAEECLNELSAAEIGTSIRAQPTWSDLPVIVVTRDEDPGNRLKAFAEFGNVSVLTRPMNLDALVTTVESALRARRRQYQVRDLLREREASARRKDEFLAMLAHELRNPLAPVRTTLHLLKLSHEHHQTTQNAVGIAERSIKHLAHLIEDLLDASRMTLGKVALRTERLDMREVLRYAIEALRAAYSEKGVTLLFDEQPSPLSVIGDPARLDQVVMNILDNALKYTDRGGTVRVQVATEGAQLLLRVIDSGVGIAPQDLPHVCELFVQADHSLDRAAGGVGVGLTIVKGIIELHGGELKIASGGIGQGTTVSVLLPLAAPVEELPPLKIKPRLQTQPRVLVVDDNRDGADSLAAFLELTGCETRTAYDGPQAIDACREFQPSAVLLDIGLPGMNGYDVAERLRTSPEGAQATLIAVTGYSREEDRVRAREVGFDYHLVKPVDLELVSTLVCSTFRSKSAA